MLNQKVRRTSSKYADLLTNITLDFKREQKVGQGGFSTVYKAFWKPRQIEVAIKVFQGLSS